jgi:hypothetical protein
LPIRAAQAQVFAGPTIGAEAGYEDYDGAEGATVALFAGWDFAIAPDWIVGAGARFNIWNDSAFVPFVGAGFDIFFY